MRGKPQAQPEFLTTINLNQRVPADHPLRGIKERVDKVMVKLSPLFDELYADEGRPSIPPEQLLKGRILMALYSVRSERLFCEPLAYNLLWLWFLDRELDEGSFDPTVFTHNYDRVLSAEAARLFFVEAYDLSRVEGWTSDQHFTADGTLVEAWASLKSFVRKDGTDRDKIALAKDDDPGNPTVNLHGEKRSNATHRSTTDARKRALSEGQRPGQQAVFWDAGVDGDGRGLWGFCHAIFHPTAAADGWRAGCLPVGAVRAALAFQCPDRARGSGQQSMPFALNRGKIIFQKYI
jgi:transposase